MSLIRLFRRKLRDTEKKIGIDLGLKSEESFPGPNSHGRLQAQQGRARSRESDSQERSFFGSCSLMPKALWDLCSDKFKATSKYLSVVGWNLELAFCRITGSNQVQGGPWK